MAEFDLLKKTASHKREICLQRNGLHRSFDDYKKRRQKTYKVCVLGFFFLDDKQTYCTFWSLYQRLTLELFLSVKLLKSQIYSFMHPGSYKGGQDIERWASKRSIW